MTNVIIIFNIILVAWVKYKKEKVYKLEKKE